MSVSNKQKENMSIEREYEKGCSVGHTGAHKLKKHHYPKRNVTIKNVKCPWNYEKMSLKLKQALFQKSCRFVFFRKTGIPDVRRTIDTAPRLVLAVAHREVLA
jgi:hypothetical protein